MFALWPSPGPHDRDRSRECSHENYGYRDEGWGWRRVRARTVVASRKAGAVEGRRIAYTLLDRPANYRWGRDVAQRNEVRIARLGCECR